MRKAKSEITDDPVVLRIITELRKQKKTGKEFETELGLSNGTLTKWKYQGSKSYMMYLEKIALYLNITPEYLCGEEIPYEREPLLSVTESYLINLFRQMGLGERNCMIQTAEYFVRSSDTERKK